MSDRTPIERAQKLPVRAAKAQWPVVVGSFVTGVAAMTLVGVAAPTIATAGAPAEVTAPRETPLLAFETAPEGLVEMTPLERAALDARIAEAERVLSDARAKTDEALARLDALTASRGF